MNAFYRRRWFILKLDFLYYFKTESDQTPLGSFPVQYAWCGVSAQCLGCGVWSDGTTHLVSLLENGCCCVECMICAVKFVNSTLRIVYHVLFRI